jgi:hypothetical protein
VERSACWCECIKLGNGSAGYFYHVLMTLGLILALVVLMSRCGQELHGHNLFYVGTENFYIVINYVTRAVELGLSRPVMIKQSD